MADQDEVEALRARVAQLEADRPRRAFPWMKLAVGIVGVLIFLTLVQAVFGPRTYGDVAAQDAAACVRTGNDGAWYPGDGNLQDICKIRGAAKALRRQGIDAAQPR